MRTSNLAVLIMLAFLSLPACGQNQKNNGLTAYDVPMSFLPDTGSINLIKRTRHIQQAEYGILLTQEVLAKHIDGFQPSLHGVSQDTSVIVSVYNPSIHDDWEPPPHVVKNWDDIWTMSGNSILACMGDEPDNMTGYYRYHTLCDPKPNLNAPFVLMDRIPDSSKPRPTSQSYVKGTCNIHGNLVRPEDGPYHNCLFSRRNSWGDRYTFRLRGENVRLLSEVESFISGLLETWRVDPSNAKS